MGLSTWVVAANRNKARFFEITDSGEPLKEFHTLVNPEVRVRNQDLVTDRPGAQVDGSGSGMHALAPGHDEKQHQTSLFAGQVADVIDGARKRNELHHFYLLAEPRFLGELRGKMDKQTLDLVRKSWDKDVVEGDPGRIQAYLNS